MLEVAHDPLDRVLHAVEAFEGLVDFYRAIEEETPETGILRCVHEVRLADRGDDPFGRRRIEHLVVARGQQPITQRHRLITLARIIPGENIEHIKRAHRARLLVRPTRPLHAYYVVALLGRDKTREPNARD